MISLFVAMCASTGLVDTGSEYNILSARFYARILKSKGQIDIVEEEPLKRLLSANSSPLKVTLKVQADIKIGGLAIPCTFLVVDKLVHDVIIGNELLQETGAVGDAKSNTSSLYDGMNVVPMTKTGEHLIVRTVDEVTIPVYSEAIIAVNCNKKP